MNKNMHYYMSSKSSICFCTPHDLKKSQIWETKKIINMQGLKNTTLIHLPKGKKF